MKTVLLLLVLLLVPLIVQGGDLRDHRGDTVLVTETLIAADTVGNAMRRDTFWTPHYDIEDAKIVHFFTDLRVSADSVMDYTADTFFLKIQTSMNGSYWTTYEIDTLLDVTTTGGAYDEFILKAEDSAFGKLIRGMVIHLDSLEDDVGEADSLGVTRSVTAWFWVIAR